MLKCLSISSSEWKYFQLLPMFESLTGWARWPTSDVTPRDRFASLFVQNLTKGDFIWRYHWRKNNAASQNPLSFSVHIPAGTPVVSLQMSGFCFQNFIHAGSSSSFFYVQKMNLYSRVMFTIGICRVSDMQIHKRKYTNTVYTQIQ